MAKDLCKMHPKVRARYRKELIQYLIGVDDAGMKSIVVNHKKTFGDLDDCIWLIDNYFPKTGNARKALELMQAETQSET